jgi:hypothetical protein
LLHACFSAGKSDDSKINFIIESLLLYQVVEEKIKLHLWKHYQGNQLQMQKSVLQKW